MTQPFDLQSKYKPCGDQPQAIDTLVDGFRKKKRKYQTLLGVTGSGKTFTMANIIQQLDKRVLILAPNKTLAAQLYAEFRDFFPHNRVEYFVSYYDYYRPEAYKVTTDTYIEKDSAVNDDIDKLRHSTTRSLLDTKNVIVIASISCIYGIGSPSEYEQMQLSLFVAQEYDLGELIANLISIQYSRNEVEFTRGTFRVRGEALEIFAAYEDSVVVRCEFFDETLEEISLVDPLTGVKIRNVNKVSIYPASHYVVSKEVMKKALVEIKHDLQERLAYFEKENKLVEKQRLETRCIHDIEMMEEMGFCSGIENYSRHFTDLAPGMPPYTLLDFFKKDFLLIIDESHIAISQIQGMYKGDYARKKALVDYGFRLPSALDNRPLQYEEFWDRVDQVLFVSATPNVIELEKCEGEVVEQIIRPTGLLDPILEVKNSTFQVDDLYKECLNVIEKNERVLITTLTKKLAQELSDYFIAKGIKAKYLHSEIDTLERMKILKELREGIFDVLIGINLLREGLDLPEVSLVGITDADQEGFLRSATSLIQTIGRAARNDHGKVIMYARKTTKAMEFAIRETNRRRELQESFNKENGIIPKTIHSGIKLGIMEILKESKGARKLRKGQQSTTKDSLVNIADREKLQEELTVLHKQMLECSKKLEFEKAAMIRDKIKELKLLALL